MTQRLKATATGPGTGLRVGREALLATLPDDSLPVRQDRSSPVCGVKNELSVDLVADKRDSAGRPPQTNATGPDGGNGDTQ
jgi:hypothetical protein